MHADRTIGGGVDERLAFGFHGGVRDGPAVEESDAECLVGRATVKNNAENLIQGNVLDERVFAHAKQNPPPIPTPVTVPRFIIDFRNSRHAKILGNNVILLRSSSADAMLHLSQDCGSSIEFDFELGSVRDQR